MSFFLTIFLLVFAELNSGTQFLRTEFIDRLKFKKELQQFLAQTQEQLEIPQLCRQLMHSQTGSSILYDGRSHRNSDDPRFELSPTGVPPIPSHLRIQNLWLDKETIRSQVQKANGSIYILHRTHLVLEVTTTQEPLLTEVVTIPLTVTTGPGDSFVVQDCYSTNSY
ncbi:hypothetical protein [Bdellovibrio sp. BCCA]|uniref:hypothetical protein n=1 Tax=Bdellovibrio sp. BCCA TaxID=3136281 RepID=UPI0030F06EC5